MRNPVFIWLLCAVTLLLGGCAKQKPIVEPDAPTFQPEIIAGLDTFPNEKENEEAFLPELKPEENTLVLTVNKTVLSVQWEQNEAVNELFALAKEETITINTTIYGGFEQVGSLPQSFSRNDVQMTAEPGDIVLYSGNQLVVFFGSNSWSYTKLGHIDLSAEELTLLLGGDLAWIEITVDK